MRIGSIATKSSKHTTRVIVHLHFDEGGWANRAPDIHHSKQAERMVELLQQLAKMPADKLSAEFLTALQTMAGILDQPSDQATSRR